MRLWVRHKQTGRLADYRDTLEQYVSSKLTKTEGQSYIYIPDIFKHKRMSSEVDADWHYV